MLLLSGGIEITVCGKKRRFLPVIGFFIQDTLEGNLLSCVNLGVKVHSPCRFCHVSKGTLAVCVCVSHVLGVAEPLAILF